MENSLQNIKLRSEEVQEILTRVPGWMILWGNTLIFSLILFCLFLLWLIKYPDSISSSAVITTNVPPQLEYAKINAKIDTIFVEDNEVITKNTVLAVLENTANLEDVFYLKSIVDTIDLKKDTFYFPLDSIPILFLGDIDASFSAFENSYIQYRLNKIYDPLSNEINANEISLVELNQRKNRLRHQLYLSKTQYDFKLNDLERHRSLLESGVISQQEFENKQVQVISAESEYTNLKNSVSQIKETIIGMRQNSKGTVISRTREEIQLLKSVIQAFNQLKKAIKDWEYSYVFKSNINGKVLLLDYKNENQTVSTGDLVFTILPTDNTQHIAKLLAPSQNSGKIKVGQKVNIKLQNYPESEFGVLQGNVKNISTTPNNEGHYLVDVTLPKRFITSYKKEIEFKPGMMGTAEIVTDDLRLLERLLSQFKQLFD